MTQHEDVRPAIEVREARKTYGPIVALDDVTFRLLPGEVHALLGHNGAGKSTLVKVLAGVVGLDGGEVLINGQPVVLRSPRDAQSAGIAVVEQELSQVASLTVFENVLLGSIRTGASRQSSVSRDEVRALLTRLGLVDVGPDTLVEDLSIGERQLVEIARALSRRARVLILDEPTATLTEREIRRVFTAVRELVAEGCSVIFVSHRLGEVLELCSRVTVMRDGKVTITRDVAGLDRTSIVQLMLGQEPARIEHRVADRTRHDDLVKVRTLEVPGHVEDFAASVAGGEIVGIAGQVGSGASEVLRALAGLIPDARGEVTVGDRPMRLGAPVRSLVAGVVFASNDRKSEGLFLQQSIARNLVATRLRALSAAGVVKTRSESRLARTLIDIIGIDPRRSKQQVSTLSGGNQQKVFLGRCLDRPDAQLLLFDEPTRGVDVGGRAEIHNLIRHAAAMGNAVIFVSTDHEEILELADTVVSMFAGRVTRAIARENTDASMVLGDMTHGGSREVAA